MRTFGHAPRSANHRSRKGSAAVEFAILGTLFATLLAVAMDYARLFYYADEVANAARAGVQYGMSSSAHWSDYTGMQTAATNDSSNVTGLTATASKFCTCSDGTSATCGSGCSPQRVYVKVVTSYTFSTFGTYPWLPSSVPISTQVSMRVQ